MDVELTLLERLELSKLLPEKGSFGDLRMIRKLQEALEYKPAECEKYGIVYFPMTNEWKWSPLAAKLTRKFVLVARAVDLIRVSLMNLNAAGTLPKAACSLFEKFSLEKLPDEEEVVSLGDMPDIPILEALNGLDNATSDQSSPTVRDP